MQADSVNLFSTDMECLIDGPMMKLMAHPSTNDELGMSAMDVGVPTSNLGT